MFIPRDGACIGLWQQTAERKFDIAVKKFQERYDVVIAGGGITGLTTGLLLRKAGKSVLIAESNSLGFGTSGGTTAHLNTFLDTTYHQIEKNFSAVSALQMADAIRDALALIKENIDFYKIDCGYKKAKAFLYSTDKKQSDELNEIYKACKRVKVDIAKAAEIPINASFQKALVFGNQAQFHPLRYIAGLAEAFVKAGGDIAESCRVLEAEEKENLYINTEKGNVQATYLIYATHIPPGINQLHLQCTPYRSYAMAVKLKHENAYPMALVYDMEDPYHYMRTQEIDGKKYLIAGGEDHKTGHQENTENCFRKLEVFVKNHFEVDTVTNKWSSQYFEAADGLPYVGHAPGAKNVFVATGFGGNGMMHSAIAAMVLKDLVLSGKNNLAELLSPNRIKIFEGFSAAIKQTGEAVANFFEGLWSKEKLYEMSELAHGEAKVVNYEGHKIGIYKDLNGNIHAVNTACTHMKCEVAWNSAENTWDCPCHGSRFNIHGEVVTAPAVKGLQKIFP